jgi:hypothetical protein
MSDFLDSYEISLPKNLKNPTKDFTKAAAFSGELGLLQELRQLNPPCPWDEMTCAAASMNGHLDILQWALENGCPCDKYTYIYAAMNGHSNILDWIIRNTPEYADVLISFIKQIATNHQDVIDWLKKKYP